MSDEGGDGYDDDPDGSGSANTLVNVTIDNNGAGGIGVGEGQHVELDSVRITGGPENSHGITNKGTVGIQNSHVDSGEFAYVGLPDSMLSADNTTFSGRTADIAYHETAELLIYDSIATNILKLTGGPPVFVDPAELDTGEGGGPPIDQPELYHIARAVVLAESPTERENANQELRDMILDGKVKIVDLASTTSDLVTVGKILEWFYRLVLS